jgi:hypothetical protein
MAARAFDGTFRRLPKCEDCKEHPAVTALITWGGCKDLCRECALENGADEADVEDSNV